MALLILAVPLLAAYFLMKTDDGSSDVVRRHVESCTRCRHDPGSCETLHFLVR